MTLAVGETDSEADGDGDAEPLFEDDEHSVAENDASAVATVAVGDTDVE